MPELRVEYAQHPTKPNVAALSFRIRKGEPVAIRRIGPLVSEVKYRTEQEIISLQEVLPEVEVDRPVECEVLSLSKYIEAGGPNVSDSVQIECTIGPEHFSTRFYLHKNANGSIVWTTADSARSESPNDLGALRMIFGSLDQALGDLVYAGQLKALATECGAMETELLEIIGTRTNKELDLSWPMKRSVIFLDSAETTLPSWERLRLMSFRDRYLQYEKRCKALSLDTIPSKIPALPTIPNDNQLAAQVELMRRHRDAVFVLSDDYVTRYAATWLAGRAKVTISATDHR